MSENLVESDVIIIGAGVVGGAVARELSRFELSVICLEKEADVCCGISKANTGIIHSPALVPSGTIKSAMAVKGAEAFECLSAELGFVYQKPGALVLGFTDEDRITLDQYAENGYRVYADAGMKPPEYRILIGSEITDFEPSVNPEASCALYLPDAGRIIPYEYGIGLWENAVSNGVRLDLDSEVTSIEYDSSSKLPWIVKTSDAQYRAGFVVNASGHGSSALGAAAGFDDGKINRVKGQYIIIDRAAGPEIGKILFQVPDKKNKKKGKGILVTETVYGNIMIGPDARPQQSSSDTSTDFEALEQVIAGALKSVPGLRPEKCIKTFAGIRPRPHGRDFIIESARGFIHLCGIESPGLTSSPAIAAEVVRLLSDAGLGLSAKTGFNPVRRAIVDDVLTLPPDELKRRIGLPAGTADRIVCRCEQVPEKRIIDAVSRGIPVVTTDGVKRRTRAGQGRCQGNFCGSRVRSLLAEAAGLPEADITRRGNEPELDRITAADVRKHYGNNKSNEEAVNIIYFKR